MKYLFRLEFMGKITEQTVLLALVGSLLGRLFQTIISSPLHETAFLLRQGVRDSSVHIY